MSIVRESLRSIIDIDCSLMIVDMTIKKYTYASLFIICEREPEIYY